MKRNILLLYGGGDTEHDVSKISADYIESQVDSNQYDLFKVEIAKSKKWLYQEQEVELNFQRELKNEEFSQAIDYVIPCFHGYPGETGDIQSFLDVIGLPYFGCNSEASQICFNKITTKLWLENCGVKTTPSIFLSSDYDQKLVSKFMQENPRVYVKASNQGSSVGCYFVQSEQDVFDKISEAFHYSDFVLIEKEIKGRELEVSTFEFNGKVHATVPGEIICPDGFYSYTEKYDQSSQTQTQIVAEDITAAQAQAIQEISIKAFKALNLKDLSRIDYFLSDAEEIILNEINTFPGMTPISMFPKMMEQYGVKFSDFLTYSIEKSFS